MRFFTFMGIFLKDKEDATKPLEETPVSPVEEVVVEEPVEEVVEPVVSDPSDCGNCNGTGLVRHEGLKVDERCPVCQGKGKVN